MAPTDQDPPGAITPTDLPPTETLPDEDDGHPLNPIRINPTLSVAGLFDSYSFEPGAAVVRLHYANATVIHDELERALDTPLPLVRLNPQFTALLFPVGHTEDAAGGIWVAARVERAPAHDDTAPLIDELLTLAKTQADQFRDAT